MVSGGFLSRNNNAWIHKCGGSIITHRFILTAAHCTHGTGWSVRFGDVDLDSDHDDNDTFNRDIVHVYRHENYIPGEAYFDVGLWEVDYFEFSDFVKPICLPKFANHDIDRYKNDLASVAGWGKLSRDVTNDEMILKDTSIRIYESQFCNSTHKNTKGIEENVKHLIPRLMQPSIFCAGFELGGGSCIGDSGGPLMLYKPKLVPSDKDRYIQVGIVSGGVSECGDRDVPGIYVRLEERTILSFINNHIKNKSISGTDILLPSNHPLNQLNSDGISILNKAILNKDLANFANTLSIGADPNIQDEITGFTPLHRVCVETTAPPNYIIMLINNKYINLNILDNDKWSALARCIANQNFIGARLLIDVGVDIETRSESQITPLMESAFIGNYDITKLLLDKGADVDAVSNIGRTALHFSIISEKASSDVIILLFEHGSDPNKKDTYSGSSSFSLACGFNRELVVRYMLINGTADVTSKDFDGSTPLHNAANFNHPNIVRMLLDNGLDQLNDQDINGNTPLHLAVSKDFLEVVKVVLKYNPDLDIVNNNGLTVKQLADNSNEEIKQLITNFKAF